MLGNQKVTLNRVLLQPKIFDATFKSTHAVFCGFSSVKRRALQVWISNCIHAKQFTMTNQLARFYVTAVNRPLRTRERSEQI